MYNRMISKQVLKLVYTTYNSVSMELQVEEVWDKFFDEMVEIEISWRIEKFMNAILQIEFE